MKRDLLRLITAIAILVSQHHSHALVKSCRQILETYYLVRDSRLDELKQSTLAILLSGNGSNLSLIRHLRLLVQKTTTSATDQIRNNAVLIGSNAELYSIQIPRLPSKIPQASTWGPKLVNKMTFGWIKNDPHISTAEKTIVQAAQNLQAQHRLINKNIDQLENALATTIANQAELTKNVDLIREYITWLTTHSSESREMTLLFAKKLNLSDLYLDLNNQIAELESQVRFLGTQLDPLRNRRNVLIQRRTEINQFFQTTQWLTLQSQLQSSQARAIGHLRFPDQIPEVSEQVLAQAFDRRYYLGDRLLQVFQNDKRIYASYTFYQRLPQPDERFVSGYYRDIVKVKIVNNFLTRKMVSVFEREPYPKNLNEGSPETAYHLALARPGMKIDQFQLHQDLELDTTLAFDEISKLDFRSALPLAFVFGNINPQMKYFLQQALQSHDNFTIGFPNAETGLAGFEARKKLGLERIIEDFKTYLQGKRYFFKLLGTNPRSNTIVVAFWSFDTTTSETGPLNLLTIDRSDLKYLKTFSNASFHWPQFDYLDAPTFNPSED